MRVEDRDRATIASSRGERRREVVRARRCGRDRARCVEDHRDHEVESLTRSRWPEHDDGVLDGHVARDPTGVPEQVADVGRCRTRKARPELACSREKGISLRSAPHLLTTGDTLDDLRP